MSHKVKQTSIYIQRQISVKYEIKLFVKILILKSTIVVREFNFFTKFTKSTFLYSDFSYNYLLIYILMLTVICKSTRPEITSLQ